MDSSLATCAQYWRIGLEVGLCESAEARDWALSVIDRMDHPPGEIIEVSWRKPLAQQISDLNDVKGDRDMALVGAWLFWRLSLTLALTNTELATSVRQAKVIAQATEMLDLHEMFDVIEDGLHLAETGTYGTVAACRERFDQELKDHGRPPFSCQHR